MSATAFADRPNLVVATASATIGTTIEWYDFFLYAGLAVTLAAKFFPASDPAASVLLSAAALATGYLSRPLGGLVFGAMGDRIGRKKTFILTMALMGVGTMLIGLLPTYAQIGIAGPLLLALLRLVQGLALGGEYGGAATYIAECAPPGRTGYWTSWIQVSAGLGLVLATGSILALRLMLDGAQFDAWGWRVPFLLSAVLIGLSTWVRFRMYESPVFVRMRENGTLARSPIRSAFTDRANLKVMLLSLFGLSIGASAVNGVAFLFTPIFLQAVLKVDPTLVVGATMAGVVAGTPACLVFGALSDRVSRPRLVLAGLVLNTVAMVPIFMALERIAVHPSFWPLAGVIFFELVLFAAIHGPYAALMTELFPPSVRYTSISFPFNVANSVVGGLLPLVSLGLIAATGARLAGLAYPVGVLLVTVAVHLVWRRSFGRRAGPAPDMAELRPERMLDLEAGLGTGA